VRERRNVRRVVGIAQHARMVGRQPVAARLAVLDVEQARDGLLLEPLDGVARGDAGMARELGRGQRPMLGQGAVQAEL
jgi:hypothetical protein